jgi:peptidylprolyl isomerase
VEEGKGIPVQSGEQVAVHYYGCLTDGSMFDTSLNGGEPLAFPVGVGQMIPGFDEGVSVLKHGSKAYLFLPPALAYGDQENGAIPANSELIFYIEIQ